MKSLPFKQLHKIITMAIDRTGIDSLNAGAPKPLVVAEIIRGIWSAETAAAPPRNGLIGQLKLLYI